MINGENNIPINIMQQKRFKEHPIETEEVLLVFDNLEAGTLRLYEPLDGPVNILQIPTYCTQIKNAVLMAEAVINSNWREEGVYIHKVSCEYGHESLIQPMIDQILHFAGYYNCYQSVGISELEYNKCLPYAKESLAGFEKINRVYVCQINR